jgi:hypothetical protein
MSAGRELSCVTVTVVFARRIAFGSDAAVGPVEICVTVEMKVRQGEDEEKIDIIMARVSFVFAGW